MAKILVIDDEPGMRQVTAKVVSQQGHQAVQAEDGAQALDLFKKENPDLVLLDIRLPDMDGLEILGKIRAMKPELPVIMLSGFGDVETAVELVRQGAFDYISKPFKVDKLIELVNAALNTGQVTSSEPSVAGLTQPKQAVAAPKEKKEPERSAKIEIKNSVIIFAAGILLLLAGGFFGYTKIFKPVPEAEFAIPYANPSALCWDGKNLWVSDWMQETVYKHVADEKLSVVAAYTLPDMQITGIAFDGEYLWTCSSFEKKIYKHRLDYNLSVVTTFDAPGPGISGLYFYGNNLWTLDFQQGKAYEHANDGKLTILNTYETPAANPCSMFIKGKSVYIADARTNIIYKIEPENFTLQKSYILPHYKNTKYHLAGVSYDGKSLWSCADEMQKVIRHPFKSLEVVE